MNFGKSNLEESVSVPIQAEDSELEIITFGCRLNAYESDQMRQLAAQAGLRSAILVNSCAVTIEAERQTRQAIRKARRRRPEVPILVTGCAAQINPTGFAAMPQVDRVIGNDLKLQVDSYRLENVETLPISVQSASDLFSPSDSAAYSHAQIHRARAYLNVQNGCDHRCSFCIIPYGRGPSRSVPLGVLVMQARALVAAGHRELVVTGVDLTAYGTDLPGRPSLGQMIRRLLAQVPELPRLRLSSLDPAEAAADVTLLRLLADEPRLMPHLHLSMQAGDDLILKRMKRRHNREQALQFCHHARRLRPGLSLGADLIAGFPTETEAMFEKSLAFIAEAELQWLHVFPYSPRPGTPAARMPQIPLSIRRDRAKQLRSAGTGNATRFLQNMVGSEADVLIEKTQTDMAFGHSAHFAPIMIPIESKQKCSGFSLAPGSLVSVRIMACEALCLQAQLISQTPPISPSQTLISHSASLL